MKQVKVTPINIEKAQNVKGASKNISDILDFMISVSREFNGAIPLINKILEGESNQYDDSNLKDAISEIEKAIKNLDLNYDDTELKKELASIKSSIKNYDDAAIKKTIDDVKKSIPSPYDDEHINKQIESALDEIKNLKEANELLSGEVQSLKKTVTSNQKEIRSYRKESVRNLNLLEHRVNDITEVK